MNIIIFECVLMLLCSYTYSSPIGNKDVFRAFYEMPSLNAVQGKIIQITKPQPILDTITEAEKCCNTQQHPIGQNFLRVFEKTTSALANVAQVPKQKSDKIGATVTVVLNQIGGKIVGLQK